MTNTKQQTAVKQIKKHLELPHRETVISTNTLQTKPFDNQKINMSNNKQRMKVYTEEQILQEFKNNVLECLKDVTLTSAQTNHIYKCYLFALEKGFISDTINWLPSYIFYKNLLRGLSHAKISIDVHEKILALYQQTQKIELDCFEREEMKSSKKSNYINTMFYASN